MCIPQRKRVGCDDKRTLIRFFSPLYLNYITSRERRRRILLRKGDSSYSSLSVSLSLQMSGSSGIIHRRGFSSSFRNTIVVTKKKKTLKKKSTSTVSAFGGGGGRVGTEKSNTDRPMSEVLEKQYQKLKEIQENAGTTPMENEQQEQHRVMTSSTSGTVFSRMQKREFRKFTCLLFCLLPLNFDASPNEFVESAKRWELEQSAKIWDAVDALIELGKRALFGGEKIEFSYATEKATSAVNALAEVARANVPAGTDLTKLDEALKAVTSSTSEYALYAAMIAFFGVVLVVLSNSADPNKGMDEWAALAAKEGEEEPEAL